MGPSRKSTGPMSDDVGGGPDRDDARQRLGGGGVDEREWAVRDMRAHHAHVKLAGKLRSAAKQPRPVTSGGSSSRSTAWPIHCVALVCSFIGPAPRRIARATRPCARGRGDSQRGLGVFHGVGRVGGGLCGLLKGGTIGGTAVKRGLGPGEPSRRRLRRRRARCGHRRSRRHSIAIGYDGHGDGEIAGPAAEFAEAHARVVSQKWNADFGEKLVLCQRPLS